MTEEIVVSVEENVETEVSVVSVVTKVKLKEGENR
jgi:hypothetical protein